MAFPDAEPPTLLFRKRFWEITAWFTPLLFARARPAVLFWIMLLRTCAPDVPEARVTPKRFGVILLFVPAPWMVNPSMTTLLTVTLKGEKPTPSTIDSAALRVRASTPNCFPRRLTCLLTA